MLSDQSAAELLGSLASLIRTSRVVAHKTHGHSATGTQVGVLKLVREQSLRLGDLATQLMVAPSVASRVVAALESDGLVVRHPDPADARACLIGLTETGRARLAEREQYSHRQLREVLDDWTEADAQNAADVLRRLESRVAEFTVRLAEQPSLVAEPSINVTADSTDSGPPARATPPVPPREALATDRNTDRTHDLEMEHQPA